MFLSETIFLVGACVCRPCGKEGSVGLDRRRRVVTVDDLLIFVPNRVVDL